MKNLVTGLVALCITGSVFAQETSRDSLIKTPSVKKSGFFNNPIALFISGFEIGYSRNLVNAKSARIIAGIYSGETTTIFPDKTVGTEKKSFKNFEAFKLEFQYLFMKPKIDELSYFVGPFANFKTISIDVTNEKPQGSLIIKSQYKARAAVSTIGFLTGVTVYINNSVFFDVYAGGGITMPITGDWTEDVHQPVTFPFLRSINPKAGINIGILF